MVTSENNRVNFCEKDKVLGLIWIKIKMHINNIWFTLHEVGVVLRQEDRVSIDCPRFAKDTKKNLPAYVFNFQWTRELSVLDLTNQYLLRYWFVKIVELYLV